MDAVRLGRQLRALRQRRRWRQIESVAAALGIRLDVRLQGGSDLDRLLDAGQAAVVEEVVRRLTRWAWEVEAETTFAVYGERGSIDVLAWHAQTRVLLIVEVKTALTDLQSTLSTLDRKVRLAPRIVAQRGWSPTAVARVIVLPEDRTARRLVAAHASTFDAVLPTRGRAVLSWLRRPTAVPLRGLIFLTVIHSAGRRQPRRVRRDHAAAFPRSITEPLAPSRRCGTA